MPQIKPNDFPVRTVLDGTEEVYTQTNGINQKFLLSNAVNYITNNIDLWNLKTIYVDEVDLFNISNGNTLQVLDEADLNPNEYYEINRIIIELTHNITYTVSNDIWFQFKQNSSIPFLSSYNFYQFPYGILLASEDVITCSYTPWNHVPYPRNTGLYIHSAKQTLFGNGTFKIKIYYKINS
jgi:hypothetical protein